MVQPRRGFLQRLFDLVGGFTTGDTDDPALAAEIELNLKTAAPFDTGALFRSIRVRSEGAGSFQVTMNDYGYIQNSPEGQHTGWIDRVVENFPAELFSYVQIQTS